MCELVDSERSDFDEDSSSDWRVCAGGQVRGGSARGRPPEHLMTASCSFLLRFVPVVE